MPPDLNSLPPSRSPSSSSLQQRNVPVPSDASLPSAPPRLSTDSLTTTATPMNATDLSSHWSSRGSPRTGRLSVSERRRSAVGMNLNLNDATTGELPMSDHRSSMGHAFRTASPTSIGGSPIIATGDPHHQRAPSLGELHQELEQEQEAQVNRLLQMIRSQQVQLQQLQQQQQQQQHQQSPRQSQPSSLSISGTAVVDDSTPSSERSVSFPSIPPLPAAGNRGSTQLPSSLSNRHGSSRPSSQATSPSLRPLASVPSGTSGESLRGSDGFEWIAGASDAPARRGSRDESAFYQTEAAMLTRENQMLRQRIRDLERQISELTTPTHQPASARSGIVAAPSAREGTESADHSAATDTGSACEAADKT